MKTKTKRSLFRWIHIIAGSVVATYIYSPLGQLPTFQILTKIIIIPLVVLSGLWLWKGHLLRKLKK